MKKIYITLLITALISSCYRDLGNYDYNLDSMNEITSVTFSPAIVETTNGQTIEMQRALSEQDTIRRIEAFVEQTLAKNYDKLTFNWAVSYIDKDGKMVNDSITTPGYLDVILPIGKEVTYNVFLQIYDQTTQLSHYSRFKVMTRPLFKNSLFLLHGNEGNRKLGNIETIGSETKVRSDITSIIPGNTYSDATGLAFTTFYDIDINHLDKQNYAHTLTVFANGLATKAYNPFGMERKFSSDEIFKPENENFKFKKIVQTGDPSNNSLYKVVLTEDGNVYIGNTLHALYKPGYSFEQNDEDLQHQKDYTITAATITHNRIVFWDAKNNRFLYCAKNSKGMAENEESSRNPNMMSSNPLLDANIDYNTLDKSPEGLTAVIGYINYRENYEGQSAYFIFKEEDSGKLYRYALKQLTTGESKEEMATSPNRKTGEVKKKPAFSVTCEEMSNIKPACNLSTITYNSWFTNNFLFYADNNTVYRYNMLSGDNVTIYKAPSGYEITMIKFRSEDSHIYSGDLGLYMSIALYDGTNGAITEIKLNTAGDVDKNFVQLLYDKDDDGKKWGVIKDMQFTRDYIYERGDF